MFSPIK